MCPQGDFVIMDGADIQRLYEVRCGPFHAPLINDYLLPIARSEPKGFSVFGYSSGYHYVTSLSLHCYCTRML